MESAQLRKDRQDSAVRRRSLIEDSCEVLDAEGTLWRCHDSVMTPCIIILDLTLTRHFTVKES